MVKRCQIYFIGLKKNLCGCFTIEEIRDKDNETGLKEGGGIKMSTTVLSITRCTLSFALNTYVAKHLFDKVHCTNTLKRVLITNNVF